MDNVFAKVSNINVFGNEFDFTNFKGFTCENMNNVVVNESICDGALELSSENGTYISDGYFLSPEIQVPKFQYMVLSWNADTPEGTYVEAEARVLVNHCDESGNNIQTWTDWLSWGKWSPHIDRKSASTDLPLAKVITDELKIKGSSGETAEVVQIKVTLHTDNKEVTPILRYIHGSLKNTLEGQNIEKIIDKEVDENKIYQTINIQSFSQSIRCPKISDSICSPTTMTILLNRFGENLLPEEVAHSSLDSNYGFGNWSFAAAIAGSYGYKSYVDYTTIEGLKAEISKGYPVGVSVQYSNEKNDKYPYIEGTTGRTPGHLMTICGFTKRDEVEYIVVNDSYAKDNESARREYKVEEFKNAWKNVAYIVRDKVTNAGTSPTKRLNAELRPSNDNGKYELYYNNSKVDMTGFGGCIMYTIDDGKTFTYLCKDNSFSPIELSNELVENPNFKLYVILGLGKVYIVNNAN